jgi:hypothetical protein
MVNFYLAVFTGNEHADFSWLASQQLLQSYNDGVLVTQ